MAESKSNAGGVSARQGFEYQDHVAAKYIIEMISNPALREVQCDTLSA
jgi:hypothetical protein